MKKIRGSRSEMKRELIKCTWRESISAWRALAGIRGALLPVVATACFVGCADPGDLTDADEDPSSAMPADTTVDSAPETGVLHVKMHSSIVPLNYTVRNGRAVYQEDLVLGDVEAVRREESQRSLAIRDLSARWPGGNIRFTIKPSVPASLISVLTNAKTVYETFTPITFTEFPFAELPDDPHPKMVVGLSDEPGVSYADAVGFPGSIDPRVLNLWPGSPSSPQAATVRTVVHELGHALGLFHEQSRSDRNSNVLFSPSCVQSGKLSQFDMESTSTAEFLAPYDLNSVMHYNSGTFCITALAPAVAVPGTNCACLPLVVQGTSNTSATGFIPQPSPPPPLTLSSEDINTLWQMYEPKLGTNGANDGLGSAIAVGDFDNDGYSDIAVGAPGDRLIAGSPTSGAVYLFKGTLGGPVAWRLLNQVNSGLSVGGTDEKFGAALAVGDFNNDGFIDLFVGAPGDIAPGGVGGATPTPVVTGSVFIFNGGPTGLTPATRLDQTGFDVNEDGDEFGTALTVADFNGDGSLDLAVGAPGEVVSNGSKAGAVYMFQGSGTSFTPWQILNQSGFPGESDNDGDRFGQALASGDLGGDANPELVVGVPETTVPNRSGAVDIFTLSSPATNFTAYQAIRQVKINLPKAGDAFGASLAVADLDGDVVNGRSYMELAVGAPGKDSPLDSGRVLLFKKGASETLLASQTLSFGNSAMSGDHYGQALGVIDFNLDGLSDLLVGVPDRDVAGTDSGAVLLFKGKSFPLGQTQVYVNVNSTPDRFGSALASGNIDKIADLPDFVAGMPGATSGAGAFDFFTGAFTTPSNPAGGGYFDQETQTPQ